MARNVLHLPAEWGDFYITNSIVIVLGVASAEIAARAPAISLAFPALMLINATFFHFAPFLLKKGRFSPGLITAVLLFYPIGIYCYLKAAREGLLNPASLAVSFVLGAILMATPIVFLKIKDNPYFRRDRAG